MERRAPGVQISVTGTGIPEVREVSPAQYFAVGLYEWGPINTPLFVAGLDEFRRQFGDDVYYSSAPEHFAAAYSESRDTLSGWIVRIFETKPTTYAQVASQASVGDTDIILNTVDNLVVGDYINLATAGNENLLITNVDAVNNIITVSPALNNPASVGIQTYTTEKTLDDYRAKCTVNVENQSTPAFRLIALDPGSKGNTFKTEVAPGGLSPASDRKVRVRGRFRNYDFEWKGVGNEPAAVAEPGPYATPLEIKAYNAYKLAHKAWTSSSASAVEHNTEVCRQINELADERNIDFRIEINDEEDYGVVLQITQPQIYNTKISSNALDWSGGLNGESIDRASVYATQDQVRELTPYTAYIGDFSQNAQYTGIQALNNEFYGTGVLCVPGQDVPEVWEAIIEHAETYDRLGLINIPRGTSPQNAAVTKAEFGGSKNVAFYYGYVKKSDKWVPVTAVAAGLGSRETSRQDADGGIKASWTGRVGIQAVEQFYGRDAVDDGTAELFSRADVGLNYVKMTTGVGYRLDSQRLSLAQGAIDRVYHTVVNNTIVYSIKPAVVTLRDRTIDREGSLVEDFINTMDSFFSDYKAGRPAPRGNTLWNPAVIFDASTLNDLRNHKLRMHIQYSQSPKAEQIIIGIEQNPLTLG
jgi:hypothetical protein